MEGRHTWRARTCRSAAAGSACGAAVRGKMWHTVRAGQCSGGSYMATGAAWLPALAHRATTRPTSNVLAGALCRLAHSPSRERAACGSLQQKLCCHGQRKADAQQHPDAGLATGAVTECRCRRTCHAARAAVACHSRQLLQAAAAARWLAGHRGGLGQQAGPARQAGKPCPGGRSREGWGGTHVGQRGAGHIQQAGGMHHHEPAEWQAAEPGQRVHALQRWAGRARGHPCTLHASWAVQAVAASRDPLGHAANSWQLVPGSGSCRREARHLAGTLSSPPLPGLTSDPVNSRNCIHPPQLPSCMAEGGRRSGAERRGSAAAARRQDARMRVRRGR